MRDENTLARPVTANSLMIALLADGERNRQTISGRRQRARGVGRVGARGILEMVEIQDQLAGFVDSIGRQAGIQEAARTVSGGGASRVAQDKE